MSNPYAPPKSSENQAVTSKTHSLLRWFGFLSLGYITMETLISYSIPLASKLIGIPLLSFLAFGLLRKGPKFQLGVAIFMAFTILVQTYFMNKVIANPAIAIPANPWLFFVKSVIPYTIIVVCTFLLYLKLPRPKREAEQAVDGNPH